MGGPIDPDTWAPPDALPASSRGIRGTRYGTRLYDQPEHAAFAEQVRQFCAPDGPLNLEIGVDRGYRLLAHARRWPDQRWLGVELRRRIRQSAPHAPPNALLLQADARAVLDALIPPERLQRVDILFPTPSNRARHLLLTPALISVLESRMAPGGVLLFATDVPAMATLAEQLLYDWARTTEPPSGPVRSRREVSCARSGRSVWRWACLRPLRGGCPTEAHYV